jgi:hypothetical protein
LAEDLLADEALQGRIVGRLEAQGFGSLSDRSKASQLKKLDQQIEQATADLREACKQEALERIEAEFAGEAA